MKRALILLLIRIVITSYSIHYTKLYDTIVIYSTDNGPEHSARLHGGTTPFRGEKMTTYEGGVRVPMMVRWPGHIPAGIELDGIQAHMDLFTTLAAVAGEPDVVEKMKTERKQYIDGVV